MKTNILILLALGIVSLESCQSIKINMYKGTKVKAQTKKEVAKKEEGEEKESNKTLQASILEGDKKSPVIQPFEVPAPSPTGKQRMSKEELAKMVEEFDKKAEFFRDHPYEVSHYTQDMIRKHNKENYWTDQAEPTTPSFNDADEKAKDHPMGFSVAQVNEQGMNYHEQFGHGNKKAWWYDGNGGTSEKIDGFHEKGQEMSTEKFHKWAAKPDVSADNKGDREPKSHPNIPIGIAASQIGEQGMLLRHPPNHFHQNQRTWDEMGQGHQKTWWVDGNGGGSEKVDAFQEFGYFSKSSDEFHKLAANPLIPAVNNADREPQAHPNGFTASLAQVLKHQKDLGE